MQARCFFNVICLLFTVFESWEAFLALAVWLAAWQGPAYQQLAPFVHPHATGMFIVQCVHLEIPCNVSFYSENSRNSLQLKCFCLKIQIFLQNSSGPPPPNDFYQPLAARSWDGSNGQVRPLALINFSALAFFRQLAFFMASQTFGLNKFKVL